MGCYMTVEITTISIPKPLADKIKERIEGTGFGSVSGFVTYVMRQILSDEPTKNEGGFTKEEEAAVKQRLRSLGYLD